MEVARHSSAADPQAHASEMWGMQPRLQMSSDASRRLGRDASIPLLNLPGGGQVKAASGDGVQVRQRGGLTGRPPVNSATFTG